MSVKGGPDIITDGLVFNLDAAASLHGRGYPIGGLDVEYLIVAGGGGGGGVIGGGGGAGGLLHGYTKASLSTGSYTVTVGAGGAGGTGWNTSSQNGNVGGNSSVFSITSTGGGGGVHHGGNTTSTTKDGGSGGGGASAYSGQGGTGITGQGNNGGNNGSGDLGAGGGGAGGVGSNAGTYNAAYSKGGAGGIGKYFGYSFGRSLGYDGWFADGGGGGVRNYRGPYIAGVATHGGGNGTKTTVAAGNGSTNTGSGGGGGGYSGGNSGRIGGNGGSGVVIIKYKGPQKATGGDSIITRKGYTIHVFTSSGTFTVGGRVGGLSTSKIVGALENMDSTNYNSGNKGYFSLSTDEYIDCSDYVNDLIFNAPATVSFWLMPLHNKNTGSTLFFIANDANPISSGGGYAFLFRYGSTTGSLTGETFVVYRYDNGGQSSQVTLYGIANGYEYQNQWVNAVCVIENNTWKVYVNGELQTLTRGTNWTGSVFKFGDNISPKDRAWICTPGANINIASCKVYNIGLSADQILDNYNATKGRFGL